jgi:hypothetical protein
MRRCSHSKEMMTFFALSYQEESPWFKAAVLMSPNCDNKEIFYPLEQ